MSEETKQVDVCGPLSPIEQKRLTECESQIESGKAAFIKVGLALLRIRHERLYRATDRNFDSYCRRRWDFSGSQGHRLIEAADIALTIESNTSLLKNEGQCRALSSVKPEIRNRVWKHAAENRNSEPTVTSKEILQAAEELTGRPRKLSRDEVLELVLSQKLVKEFSYALIDVVSVDRAHRETYEIIFAIAGCTDDQVRLAFAEVRQD